GAWRRSTSAAGHRSWDLAARAADASSRATRPMARRRRGGRPGTVLVVTDQPADAVAFPELDDEQLAVVFELGERRQVHAGEVLFSPSDDHYDWVVILSGSVEVLG